MGERNPFRDNGCTKRRTTALRVFAQLKEQIAIEGAY
jgi:hypothetical protein